MENHDKFRPNVFKKNGHMQYSKVPNHQIYRKYYPNNFLFKNRILFNIKFFFNSPGCYEKSFICVKRNKSKSYSHKEEEASKCIYFVPETVKIFVESKFDKLKKIDYFSSQLKNII